MEEKFPDRSFRPIRLPGEDWRLFEPQDKELFWGANFGDTLRVKAAIDDGANVNCRDKNGRTPAFYAVLADSPECLQILLSHGAKVLVQDDDGRTPWFYVRAKTIIMLKDAIAREKAE